ncbi:MAG: DUF6444 domain-containing protein [Pseudanabaena sp.]
MVSLVTQLIEQVKQLTLRVKELESQSQSSKNSRNSSTPPSKDGFGKRTQSLRSKSGKVNGGQPEHRGQTLEWRSDPDFIEREEVNECASCGALMGDVPVEKVMARQVYDIAPIETIVTEHQVEIKSCPNCGQLNEGSFPAEASNVGFSSLARECKLICVKSGIYTEKQSSYTITNTKTDEYTQRIAR